MVTVDKGAEEEGESSTPLSRCGGSPEFLTKANFEGGGGYNLFSAEDGSGERGGRARKGHR